MQSAQKNGIHDELGAHVSSAGSLSHAPPRAAALDAVVLQLFTKQPSRWAERDVSQQALELVPRVHVLFETTAGAGRALGASFDQLAALIHRIPANLQPRLGVCFDTCHVWAAGYDLRASYHDVMARFDDTIGCERIRLFHLNDSSGALASRRDRHAHIGAGALGDEPFRHLLLDDRFTLVPKLLETPKDDDPVAADRRNLARLRALRDRA